MPPLPAAHHVIKCEIKFTDSQSARGLVNIFHVGYTGADISVTDLANFATQFDLLVNNTLTTFMTSSMTHDESVFTDLTSDTAPRVITTPGTAGGNAGARAPASAAAVVSWLIARRYRGGHPRTYLGGLIASQIAEPNTLAEPFRTNFQTAARNFVNNVALINVPGGQGFNLVNLSYYDKNVTPAPPHLRPVPFTDQITGANVHSRLDSQRRRLGRERT